LSRAALAIVEAQPRIAGVPIFAAAEHGHMKARIDSASGVSGWTVHDLRRTARSLLSRCGVNPDVGERCLGHVIGGSRGTYDRHRYLDEMLAAFEALAAQIGRIIDPQPNVVALRKGKPDA
jgi:integrase